MWSWWGELHAARGSGGFGPNPIGYSDIEAWGRLTGRDPGAFEVQCLVQLDRAFLMSQSKPKTDGH